jgi:protein-S-isoprenylcysteine O-methyltransferase Ste14
MGDDQTFRIVLLVGMLIFMPIGIYHRVRSQASREKLDRRQEGLFILFTLRPLGLAMMAGLIAFIVSPASMAWSAVPLPAWLRWTGAAIGILVGLLLAWTFHSLGKNLTDTVVTREQHTLTTTGPYRWIRHPLYTSVALATVANGLVAANWFIFITGSLAFTLLVIRCRTEEENLIARFGDEYRAYAVGTGRFLPRLRWL